MIHVMFELIPVNREIWNMKIMANEWLISPPLYLTVYTFGCLKASYAVSRIAYTQFKYNTWVRRTALKLRLMSYCKQDTNTYCLLMSNLSLCLLVMNQSLISLTEFYQCWHQSTIDCIVFIITSRIIIELLTCYCKCFLHIILIQII